jgi:hypothetical protein
MLITGAALTGGAAILSSSEAAEAPPRWKATYSGGPIDAPAQAPGEPGRDYQPVITPNGVTLPWKIVDGVKVGHLIAEPVRHEFTKGLQANCWGYNGRVHGPTIEAVEGDRLRIYVTNKLPAPTTVHWHGIYLPCGMDGVGGLTQRSIPPGDTFRYEFTLRQHGTYMYHSHHDEMTQMAMGMLGMIVVHPRKPAEDDRVDRDFAIMLSEWAIKAGTETPDPNAMSDFNILTMNGKCFPGTAPIVCKQGQRVRLRLGNLSAMDHHPIHLHGYHFVVTATDGGRIPVTAQWPETTVLVPTGSTRDVEFIADAPGDWAMHCHMTHHVMNQMGHGVPNLIGMKPGDIDSRIADLLPGYMTMGHEGMGEHGVHIEKGHMPAPPNSIPMVGGRGQFDYITMGGMFTVVKVREKLDRYDDPGWYAFPNGAVAESATKEEMKRDGVM